jgi:hypothetical protein
MSEQAPPFMSVIASALRPRSSEGVMGDLVGRGGGLHVPEESCKGKAKDRSRERSESLMKAEPWPPRWA